MRMTGRVESPSGFGPQGHLCWVRDAPGDYGAPGDCGAPGDRDASQDYRPRRYKIFTEGLGRRLRAAYVGSGGAEDLRGRAAVPAGLIPFQIFACDDGAVGLLGEFDVASEAAFGRALRSIQPVPGDSRLIFDMSAVSFMDHHALLALDSYAEACQVPVFVRSMPPMVRRVARMLGLEHLRLTRSGDSR
jgi:anti-anti-sigma regulatory factor